MQNKQKVNYFDLGLCRGLELSAMIYQIFPYLEIENYNVYGFEACKFYADNLDIYFREDDKINIYNLAIADKQKKIKLYYSPNLVGHSIFKSKSNVEENYYEEVNAIIFSEWLQENVPDFRNAFNILKVNIEGAEWHLFNDLAKNNLVKYFDIFCGQAHDIAKVAELSDKIEVYNELLEKYSIVLHRFTEHKPEQNVPMEKLIYEKMENKKCLKFSFFVPDKHI